MSDYKLLIDGKRVPGDQTMPVLNPATEEVVAQCPRASKEQLNKAVAAAKAAYPAWAATPMEELRKLIIKMAEAIEANTNELAHILTSEQGKPLADATGEVMGMAGLLRCLGSLDLPMRVVEVSGDRKVEAYRRPLGVVGAIIPWNVPFYITVGKVIPALLAGCTVILKPAPETPLIGAIVGELAAEVGFPAGLLSVVTGKDPAMLGEMLTTEPVHPSLSRLGPDLLAPDFDATEAIRRMCHPVRATDPIAEVLLDQRALAGIGNVYKSEVCFIERVDPFASTGTLDDETLRRLVATARRLLQAKAQPDGHPQRVTTGGSRHADGPLWVYDRRGRPCRRCGTPIAARRHGELPRLTFWCPTCQAGSGSMEEQW